MFREGNHIFAKKSTFLQCIPNLESMCSSFPYTRFSSKTREVEGNGEGRVREQEKRTAGQLNNNEEEESRSARTSVNYLNIEVSPLLQ